MLINAILITTYERKITISNYISCTNVFFEGIRIISGKFKIYVQVLSGSRKYQKSKSYTQYNSQVYSA